MEVENNPKKEEIKNDVEGKEENLKIDDETQIININSLLNKEDNQEPGPKEDKKEYTEENKKDEKKEDKKESKEKVEEKEKNEDNKDKDEGNIDPHLIFQKELLNIIKKQEKILLSTTTINEKFGVFNKITKEQIAGFKNNVDKYGKYLLMIKKELGMISDTMKKIKKLSNEQKK